MLDTAVAPQTPIERHGQVWLKRDDLFTAYGEPGGKARTCFSILNAAPDGTHTAVTAGSRQSPQVGIVANIARHMGLACRFHTPGGDATPEIERALRAGGERVVHTPGHNSVIVARARADAERPGHVYVPFGMECEEAVQATASQVDPASIPSGVWRIVVPIGSGMSAAGVLAGLAQHDLGLPVLGVQVGADPTRRLDTWAPMWRWRMEIQTAQQDYHVHFDANVGGVKLDPVYEAKCVPYLQPDDMLWVVGIRRSAR